MYNIGNSKTVTLNEFINTCEQVTGKKAIYNQLPEQPGDVPKTYSDITKAKEDLNWKPEYSLDTGMKEVFNWLRT